VSFLSSSRSQASPAFSPDGRRVASQSDRSGSPGIWICNADGSDPVQLTSFRGPETGSPVWSLDGKEVVFDSRLEGDAQIFAVRADGGVPRRIETGIPNSSQPSFSRDGRWLYFGGGHENAIQAYKVEYPGGRAVALTTLGGYWPREAADRQRVFYVRFAQLWSASVDGDDERAEAGFPRFVTGNSNDWAPAPGGIYFIDRTGARAALVLVAGFSLYRLLRCPG